ncbi:MAG: anthranilate synthase component I [Proteobacteria bacterium]|nr:anthranilate synthase component I [Pseudomonadota bacterium]
MKTRLPAFAAEHSATVFTHIPVVREVLADFDTPLSAYTKLCGERTGAFLLESVQGGERWGRYSIIGLPARREIRIYNGTWREFRDGEMVVERACGQPLDAIREYLSAFRVQPVPGLPRFSGGLVGYFGADLVRYIEPHLAPGRKPGNVDDVRLLLAEDIVVFDNLRGSAFMVALAETGDTAAMKNAAKRIGAMNVALQSPLPVVPTRQVRAGEFASSVGEKRFKTSVERIRDYIHEGDAMQVVLSHRMEADFDGDALDVYRALRLLNPSPYLYFLDFGDLQIAGSSPEALVRVEDNEVTVRPIAGTRKRGATTADDQALERELHADPKERAEHLMLIDLGRNDVGRISDIGSVKVTEQMVTERYSHVMHLVSNVTGKLREDCDALDALAACFPAGTLSGAPKLRALEIIDELEPEARGIYSGAVGYLGWQGNLDTAIAIRTAIIRNGKLQVQAGAGIVFDSDPDSEWEETLHKSRALREAMMMVANGMQLGGTDK